MLRNVCHLEYGDRDGVQWDMLLFRLRFGMDKEKVYALCLD